MCFVGQLTVKESGGGGEGWGWGVEGWLWWLQSGRSLQAQVFEQFLPSQWCSLGRPLGGGALLKEVGHWEMFLSVLVLATSHSLSEGAVWPQPPSSQNVSPRVSPNRPLSPLSCFCRGSLLTTSGKLTRRWLETTGPDQGSESQLVLSSKPLLEKAAYWGGRASFRYSFHSLLGLLSQTREIWAPENPCSNKNGNEGSAIRPRACVL